MALGGRVIFIAWQRENHVPPCWLISSFSAALGTAMVIGIGRINMHTGMSAFMVSARTVLA